MNGYNFTERVRKVLMMAREEAIALKHEYVGTEHILLGIIAEGGGVANAALENLAADQERLREDVIQAVKPGQHMDAHRGDLPYTSRAKRVLELSMDTARNLGHSYVGTEHLLLGLMREERGIAAQVLMAQNLTTAKLQDEVVRLLGTEPPRTFGTRRASTPESRPERQAQITVVIEHPDGRIEAKKFRRSGEAVTFINGLEY